MSTVRLDIDDNKLDLFLTIIKGLRSDIVTKITIEKSSAVSSIGKIDASHIEEVSDEENEYYVGLFENMKDEQREIISTKIFEI